MINDTIQEFQNKIQSNELERNLAKKKMEDQRSVLKKEKEEIPLMLQENDKMELHIKRCFQKREKIT